MPDSGFPAMSENVWMTKAEFAAARQISLGSAHRLIRQRRWERHPGDDGRTRILVPRHWAEPRVPNDTAATSAQASPCLAETAGSETSSGDASALREEIARLRAALDTARSGRRAAEVARDQERQGRIAAEHALSDARQEAEQARETAATVGRARELAAAEERAEQITREAAFAQLRRLSEATAARRALTRWARLRLAWRGD